MGQKFAMESLAGRVILLWGWKRILAASLAGAAAAFSQPPFDFFAVCFVSFPVLVWLLDGTASPPGLGLLRRIAPYFAVGWWFGFGYFLVGLWWTGVAVLTEGDAFAWALPFAVVGLPALLAVFYGFATLLARLLWAEGLGRIVALAFAFGLAEWLRATLFTGFPWNAIGYAATPIPLLMQSERLTGLFGMSALAVLVFSAPALLGPGLRRSRTGLAIAAALIILHPLYGVVRLAGTPQAERFLQVRIVQPSIDQTDKWDRDDRSRIFNTYLQMSSAPAANEQPPTELIVWPETAVPFLLMQHPEALASLGELVEDGQTLLVGAVRSGDADGTVRYYNSAVAINSAGEIADAVDKIHLVPFGEYVPFGSLLKSLGITELVEAVGPFTSGAVRHAITVPNGLKAVPFICYEIIFPALVDRAVTGADMMINLTNDAWFGNTPGPYQHFRQARLRAVETGLPLVRAANNGISAVVDGYGRVVDALGMNAVGVLDAAVPIGRADRLSFGTPALNGLVILIGFGLWASFLRWRSRFRAN